jgi:hypothetical protein
MAWVGPKMKVALIVLAFLALVVLVNRLFYAERLEIRECRDKQGLSVPCPYP